ncbi:hypothetical protein Poli38472_011674 [Pythium oligandrum]|uniref:Uncharacterized protein n=1 Tax=Pythium oligandrum TaxID=41045 RepID=A0A8K1C7I7_PYTOL|nr:hypothetical protein Poli38472_011674 [Pythium oligandrum]|eukprot:TMW58086.1 hypothetical protein Poli38472_011674 [Pythium oligandrum]
MWQRIAERQLKEHERSLTEKARLRALVDEHLGTTKRLERLILKGCTRSQEMMWPLEEHLKTALGSNPLKDPAVEAQMRQTTLDMYSEVDRIVTDTRFRTKNYTLPLVVEDLGINNLGRRSIEVLEATVLPFDLDMTAETFWSMWMLQTYGPLKMTRLHAGDDRSISSGIAC